MISMLDKWAEQRQKFPIPLQQEEHHQAGPRKPCSGFREAGGGVTSELLWRRGSLSLTSGDTTLTQPEAEADFFPWIHCEWPTRALGRRDPGRWAPRWLPLLMTSSSEIWFSSFWRRKWEPPAEPFWWSWLEGKDSGLRMSSGRILLISFVSQFCEQLLWNPESLCLLPCREDAMLPLGEQVWNQGRNLSPFVMGNKRVGTEYNYVETS